MMPTEITVAERRNALMDSRYAYFARSVSGTAWEQVDCEWYREIRGLMRAMVEQGKPLRMTVAKVRRNGGAA